MLTFFGKIFRNELKQFLKLCHIVDSQRGKMDYYTTCEYRTPKSTSACEQSFRGLPNTGQGQIQDDHHENIPI